MRVSAIFVREKAHLNYLIDIQEANIDSIWCEVFLQGNDTLLIRSPSSEHETITELDKLLQASVNKSLSSADSWGFNFREIDLEHMVLSVNANHPATVLHNM